MKGDYTMYLEKEISNLLEDKAHNKKLYEELINPNNNSFPSPDVLFVRNVLFRSLSDSDIAKLTKEAIEDINNTLFQKQTEQFLKILSNELRKSNEETLSEMFDFVLYLYKQEEDVPNLEWLKRRLGIIHPMSKYWDKNPGIYKEGLINELKFCVDGIEETQKRIPSPERLYQNYFKHLFVEYHAGMKGLNLYVLIISFQAFQRENDISHNTPLSLFVNEHYSEYKI